MMHRSGAGFEAAGTLGQFHYTSRRRRLHISPWLVWVLIALAVIVAMKAAVLGTIGAADYAARIEALRAGDWFERAGAYVLQVDPLTRFVAGLFGG